MSLLYNLSKTLVLIFPASLISGQMIPEIILLITILLSIPLIYKKIIIDQLSKIFLILFTLLAFEIIFIYRIFEFQSLKYLLLFRFLLFSFLISFFFTEKKFLKIFLNLFFLIFLVLLIDSMYQFYFGENIICIKNENHYRVSSFFGDEYILGSYICRLSPIILSLSLILYKNNQYINYFILISCLTITLVSGDRISLIYSLGLIILYISLNFEKKKLLFSLVFFIILIPALTINENIKERFILKTLSELKVNNKIVFYTPFHHNYAVVSLNMFKDKPLFGHGMKSFRSKCSEKKFHYNILEKFETCSTHPHNYYLQFLSENGIFNFFLLIFIFIYCVYKFYKNFIETKITNNYLYHSKSYIYFGLCMNLFPVMPNGNFYNGWLLCLLSIYLAVVNYLEKNH